MKSILNYPVIFFLLIVFSACRKDNPEIKEQLLSGSISDGSLLLVNEGNFQFGNASVSSIDIESGEVIEDIFKSANNQALGDVAQSIYHFNKNLYVIVNNSGKIEVVNHKSFKSEASISGLTSPRYMLALSNNKAYVSDLYANAIHIIDLNTHTKTGSIPFSGWCERMCEVYGKVFVTAPNSSYLYVLNAASDQISDSILVRKGASSLVLDKYNYLWVLCSGDVSTSVNAALYKINPVNKELINSFEFPSGQNPYVLKISGNNDTLYYLNNGVFQMPVNTNTLPSSSIIPQGALNFYGMGIHPESADIYVTDAVDYVQKGKVMRYSSKGELLNTYQAGIIPSKILFK
jgi:hypothetical protein